MRFGANRAHSRLDPLQVSSRASAGHDLVGEVEECRLPLARQPDRGVAFDEQRRGRPRRGPLPALRVQRVVHPRQRALEGEGVDRVELPVPGDPAPGAARGLQRDVRPAARQVQEPRQVLVRALLPARAPGAVEPP